MAHRLRGKGKVHLDNTGSSDLGRRRWRGAGRGLPRKFVSSEKLRVKGIIDTLLMLRNGDVAPVEIKYTDDAEVNLSRKKQLFAYMLLCEQALGQECPFGILYFPDQNRSVRLTATEGDKAAVIKDLEQIWGMFRTESLPRKAPEWKCNYCEVKRYCWT